MSKPLTLFLYYAIKFRCAHRTLRFFNKTGLLVYLSFKFGYYLNLEDK